VGDGHNRIGLEVYQLGNYVGRVPSHPLGHQHRPSGVKPVPDQPGYPKWIRFINNPGKVGVRIFDRLAWVINNQKTVRRIPGEKPVKQERAAGSPRYSKIDDDRQPWKVGSAGNRPVV
jgi:hypothetical protein